MNTLLVPTVLLLLFSARFVVSQSPENPPWRPFTDVPQHCSHIIVLRGEEDRHLAKNIPFEKTVRLLHPGPNALAATRAAIMRMTPLLCQSVGRIAFGKLGSGDEREVLGAVNSFGGGDLILINVDGTFRNADGTFKGSLQPFREENLEQLLGTRLKLQETILHEAVHSAETLLGAESKDGGQKNLGKGGRAEGYSGAWGLPARTLARKVVESLKLQKGTYTEWRRIHDSFLAHRLAGRYDDHAYERALADLRDHFDRPSRFSNAPARQIAESGFMNAYGAKNWAEDMATFAAGVYIGPDVAAGLAAAGKSDDGRVDSACREMQSYKERNIPGRLGAVYSKLMFLLDLGLVNEEAAARCIGSDLGFPTVGGSGFHFFERDKLLRSFDTNVQARIGTLGALAKIFEMTADGEGTFSGKVYPAKLRLRLAVGSAGESIDNVSWPRGFYKLALVGPNSLSVRVDGAQAANFDAKDAFVLIGRSSAEYISGSVFLTQAWRPTAPIPVPQVFDPPLQIRFQMKK